MRGAMFQAGSRRMPWLLSPLFAACGYSGYDASAGAVPAPDASVQLADAASVRVSDASANIVCGNGFREGEEACDDGNELAGDGCELDCSLSVVASGAARVHSETVLDLRHNALTSLEVELIPEQLDLVLPSDVFVDEVPGAGAAAIPAGSRVHSYILHQDFPPEETVASITGIFDFRFDVIGVVYTDVSLQATDAPGIQYSGGTGRGLELNDELVLLLRRIELTVSNGSQVDQVRVFVATRDDHGIIPVPSAP